MRTVPSGEWSGAKVRVVDGEGGVYAVSVGDGAFLAVAVGYTAAVLAQIVLWRAVGNSAEGVRRAFL